MELMCGAVPTMHAGGGILKFNNKIFGSGLGGSVRHVRSLIAVSANARADVPVGLLFETRN